MDLLFACSPSLPRNRNTQKAKRLPAEKKGKNKKDGRWVGGSVFVSVPPWSRSGFWFVSGLSSGDQGMAALTPDTGCAAYGLGAYFQLGELILVPRA
jgi:hypothetical protein